MNKKKIMLVANDTTFVYNLRREVLESFINNNYEVTVVAKKIKNVTDIIDMGCKLIDLDVPRHGTNPLTDMKLYNKIKMILKKVKPNIVFTNSIKPNVYFGMACQRFSIPYIPNITGLGGALLNPGIIKNIASNLYKFGVKGSKVIFFQNDFNKNFFINNNIISSKKNYTVLPGSGINLNKYKFHQYIGNDNKIIFLMISRIMTDKGISEYLKAAENIKKKYKNTEFSIVGEYDDLSYKNKIDSLIKKDVVNYYGYRNDISKLISQSHCIIHPSYHEGMSNVLLEAGATGRPVIASNVPGCKETFIDGVSGYSVKARDSGDLVEKIEKFINLPYEDKAKMGLANRKHVEENFDRKIVVKEYLKCIEKYTK